MKKILPILCAATFAFAAQTCPGTILDFYEEHNIGTVTVNYKWRYDLDETSHTATLLRGLDIYGDVTIKNLIAVGDTLYTLTNIADGALADNPALLSVTVPNTVLEIGDEVFRDCTSLASATLTYGIRYIGARPFVNTIVREIALPNSLLDMGGNISAGTLFTSTISISDSSHFKYSDDGVLYNRDMTKLYACPTRAEGTVTIPNTVTNIATDAFFGCHRLSYLNIPEAVNTIGEGAFNVAGIWPGLSAPESVPKLLSMYYYGPVPAAADDIYDGAPADLVNYALDESWSGMTSWKGREVKFIGNVPPIRWWTDPATGITWYYHVDNNVAEIWNNGDTAVSSADPLMSISLPTVIEGYVVKGVGDGALSKMRGLTSVSIPDTYERIGDYAFSNCTSLASISIGNSVSSIGKAPFFKTALTTLEIPLGVDKIDGNPVAGCSRMQAISVAEGNAAFASSDGALYDKDFTTLLAVPATAETVSIPEETTASAADALTGCIRLKSLSQKLNEVTWTFNIENDKAVVSGISGDTETITIPAKLIGYETARIDPEAMNALSAVKKYESLSGTYVADNGCLYSADHKTLIRVPAAIVLPHTVKDTTTRETVEVTIVPAIKHSGDEGNDSTSITTNITRSTSSSSGDTTFVPGDISTETLLSGVTRIEDYAFYGCNVFDETPSVENNTLDGVTGFDRNGNAYVTTKHCTTTSKKEYSTVIEVGDDVSFGPNATTGSGVVLKRGGGNPPSPPNISPDQLASGASYVASIVKGGKIVGSATVKVGKSTDKITATVTLVGESSGRKVKSLRELEAYGEVMYFMDVSKSDKTAFDKFKGKCWTLALAPAEATHPLLGGYTALSISVKAKGKVQIKGTAADGTKISASAQMTKAGDTFYIPATVRMYSRKRGGFSTIFTIRDGALGIEGGAVDFTAVVGGMQIASPLKLVASGPRADAAFGSLSIWGHEGEYELGDGQKMPRLTKSTGLVKGSLTLYRKSDGKRVKAVVNGVAVGGTGYGSAVVKNTASWPVELK